MKKLLIPALAALMLSGCSSFPSDYMQRLTSPLSSKEQALSELGDRWTAAPAITYVKASTGESAHRLAEMPEELANKKIDFALGANEKLSLQDVVGALRHQGVVVIPRLTDTQVEDFSLNNFKGTLRNLFELIGQMHNISYEYRSGVIFMTEATKWSVTMPQHKELLERTVEGLKTLGIEKASYDLSAGKVYFEAKPDVVEAAKEYITSVSSNTAMVTLQVAVLTVGHNRDRSVGFDWAGLNTSYGKDSLSPGSSSSGLGTLVKMTSSGVGLTFQGSNFSLSAAINAMSKYGTARTEQNVTMGTLSGMPVKITSGNEIPYVRTIGSTVGSGGSVSGSTSTDIIKSGLDLSVTPHFDNKDNSVVTNVSVNMSTLVGFRELSAGNNLGTLSQPEMQKITFENVGRMAAGDTLVVGGISYDQMSNNYQTLAGLEKTKLAGDNQKLTRQTIYIVVRPTIVIFTPDAERLTAELERKNAAFNSPATGQPGIIPSSVQAVPVEVKPVAIQAKPVANSVPEAKATPVKNANKAESAPTQEPALKSVPVAKVADRPADEAKPATVERVAPQPKPVPEAKPAPESKFLPAFKPLTHHVATPSGGAKND